MTDSVKVLLVDDHAVLRKGMIMLLSDEPDIVVVGEASDGEEAVAQVRALQPDVVVMDISMPRLDGIEATRQIVAESPHSKVISLSIHAAKNFVDNMLSAGASGYLLKESVPEELIMGIRAVMRGEMYLSSAITATVVSAYVEGVSNAQPEDSPAADVGILRTKLHRPPVTRDLVPRPRLFELLDAGRPRPLTLVSAPAGYGKSVLISSWLESGDWPSAWLSLDESDSDLHQFLHYFVAAVRDVFADVLKDTLSLSNTQGLPSLAGLVTSLSNELEVIDKPFILVLDNYDRIDARSPVNDLLQQLLVRPPIPLHLVFITRRDPPLSLLSLRAQNQVTDVRTQDLRFTLAETRELMAKVIAFTPGDETLDNLQQELEGWAVGLRLVALAVSQVENPDEILKNLRGGIQQAQEYLTHEVVAKQSPPMQEWLVKSSVLDRLCGPLCDAVCGNEASTGVADLDGDGFIVAALTSNLFVIPLDLQGEWFRFHHMFQQLLQRELGKRLTPDEITRLHLCASDWFESQGLVEEALAHTLASGDTERAAQIVEQKARTLLNEGQWYVLEKWVTRLPDSVVHGRPELLLALAWVRYYHMDVVAIPPLLDRIDELMEGDVETHRLSGAVAVLRSFIAYALNDGARSLQYAEHALDQLDVMDVHFRARSELFFGLAGQMEGQRERVTRVLTEWLEDPSPLHPLREKILAHSLTFVNYIAGDMREAERYIRQRNVVISHGLENLVPWNDYFAGLVHLQRGELDQAIHFLKEAASRKYFHHIRGAIDTLAALTFAYQMQGQPDQADATLESLGEFVTRLDSFFSVLTDSCAARLALMQGRSEAAFGWLSTNASPPVEGMMFWLEIPCVTWCRTLIAEGSATSLREAEDRLQEYADMNEASHNICQLIGILAMQSVACGKLGKAEQAVSHLQRALELGQSGGFIFPFIELGRPMAELLQRLPKQGDNATFVEQLLSAFGEAEVATEVVAESYRANQPFIEPLTRRELDILELLGQRLQNKEIATRLFVSPETVKTHLKHLYQKIGVDNRREAGARATEIVAASTGASRDSDHTNTR
jgi:ATP/maltotriose-dependent transcriptional regulator MalT/ActR/RegA family two-component response regulator